jgi:radical SAM superfamily enzyme YgiQ (UPF0313 family)
MRILFVYPNIGLNITINHGIAALSAFVKRSGHQTALIHVNTKKALGDLSEIERFKPGLIAMYVSTTQWQTAKLIAGRIKQKYTVPVFIGGPHPTTSPECLFETEKIDGLCIGEGEGALLELAERISKGSRISDIPNLWIREAGGISRNVVRPLIENMDELPFPDWSIFSREAVYNYPCFTFSRGCPFHCPYCINYALKNIYKDNTRFVRIKSAARAIEEIMEKRQAYDLKTINFDDDVFIKDKKWVREFCSVYRKEIRMPFNCNARVENVDRDTCSLLKDAGANMIGIGIESGDFDIRNKVLGRCISDEQIMNAFNIARSAGLKTYAFNMIGIPGETARLFEKTIALNRAVMPDDLQLSIFFPFPGTVLGEECYKKKYVKYELPLGMFNYSALDLPQFFKREDLHRYYDNFEYEVYKRSNFLKAVKSRVSKFIRRRGGAKWASLTFSRS